MMKVLEETMLKEEVQRIKQKIYDNSNHILNRIIKEDEFVRARGANDHISIHFKEWGMKIDTHLKDEYKPDEITLYVTPYEEYIGMDSEYSGVEPLVITI